MNYSLELSDEAQEDFEDILAATELRWGKDQRQKYTDVLNTALERITNDPRLGRKRVGIPPYYLLYHVGRHYIAYRIVGHTILVSRILYDRMDITRHLQ